MSKANNLITSKSHRPRSGPVPPRNINNSLAKVPSHQERPIMVTYKFGDLLPTIVRSTCTGGFALSAVREKNTSLLSARLFHGRLIRALLITIQFPYWQHCSHTAVIGGFLTLDSCQWIPESNLIIVSNVGYGEDM